MSHPPCFLLKKQVVLNDSPFWVSGACHGVKKSPLVSQLVVQDTPAGAWYKLQAAGWAARASLCKVSFCTALSSFSWRLIFLKPCNYFSESYKPPWGCCGLSFPHLDVLMAKSTEYTGTKHCAAEALLIPGALAMHSTLVESGYQHGASAVQQQRNSGETPADAFPALAQPRASPRTKAPSCTQPGKSNAAFRHMHKSSFDISITHKVFQ